MSCLMLKDLESLTQPMSSTGIAHCLPDFVSHAGGRTSLGYWCTRKELRAQLRHQDMALGKGSEKIVRTLLCSLVLRMMLRPKMSPT